MSISSISPQTQATVSQLLQACLERQLSADGFAWLHQQRQRIAAGAPARVFFLAYSAVSRHAPKDDLQLSSAELATAAAACPSWRPELWSADLAGRCWLLLALPSDDVDAFNANLDLLLSAAHIGEQVAFFQSLPLLPHPECHCFRATEGLRSNMTTVFNAIAHHNAYPARVFDEAAWNQMVLKALFVGSTLHPIWGLDERANPTLARILGDYAHERWAASRSVSPELWRLVGPFTDETNITDLDRAFADSDPLQQEAAALAFAQATLPAAAERLARCPELATEIREGRLSWERFCRDRLGS